jgi:murein DD-endopeptidase MepM/ murein hydrolase activator NlpD
MPTIPDGYAARPIPQARMRPSPVRNAGVVGEGIAGIGQGVSKLGLDMMARQDEYDFAKAKSHLIVESERLKSSLRDDPNFDTFEERYARGMKDASEQALGMIRSRGARSRFEADASVLTAQGASAVSELRHGKWVAAEQGSLISSLDATRDILAGSSDDMAIMAGLDSIDRRLASAHSLGIIDAKQLAEFRMRQSGSVAAERFDALMASGETDKARQWFDETYRYMDDDYRRAARTRLVGAEIEREDMGFITGTETPEVGQASNEGPAGASQGFVWPISDYRLGQSFGKHLSRGSAGVDILPSTRGQTGVMVHPVADGVVIERGFDGRGGNYVKVRHADGYVSEYMHFAGPPKVQKGQKVGLSTVLGEMGQTGSATGVHLHLEVLKNGRQVDPLTVLGTGIPDDEADVYGGPDRETYASGAVERARAAGITDPVRLERIRNKAEAVWQDGKAADTAREGEAWEAFQAEYETKGYDANGVNRGRSVSDFGTFQSLPPRLKIRARNLINANANKAASGGVAANGKVDTRLVVMAAREPERYAEENLLEYQPYLTSGEYQTHVAAQAKARARIKTAQETKAKALESYDVSAAAANNVRLWMKINVDPKAAFKNNAERLAVTNAVEARAAEMVVKEGKTPTPKDFQGWVKEAYAARNMYVDVPYAEESWWEDLTNIGHARKRVHPTMIKAIRSELRIELKREPTPDEIVKRAEEWVSEPE